MCRRCPALGVRSRSPARRGRLKRRANIWSPWGLVAQPGAALEAVGKGKRRLCASSRGGGRRLWGGVEPPAVPRCWPHGEAASRAQVTRLMNIPVLPHFVPLLLLLLLQVRDVRAGTLCAAARRNRLKTRVRAGTGKGSLSVLRSGVRGARGCWITQGFRAAALQPARMEVPCSQPGWILQLARRGLQRGNIVAAPTSPPGLLLPRVHQQPSTSPCGGDRDYSRSQSPGRKASKSH